MESKARKLMRGAYFFLVLVAPLPCLINFMPWFSEHKAAQQPTTISAEETKFLFREYQVVTGEIQSRIEHEHLLFILKLTVVGAVLGLIFKTYKVGERIEGEDAFRVLQQSTGAAVCCWAATAVAAIIDVRIFFNADLIIQAGSWVKKVEDLLLNSQAELGWEQSLAESPLRTSHAAPFLLADRQLLTWILYVVALGIFVPRGSDQENQQVRNIARISIPICFLVFGFVGINFYFDTGWGVLLYVGVCVMAASFTFHWVGHRRKLPMAAPVSGTMPSPS